MKIVLCKGRSGGVVERSTGLIHSREKFLRQKIGHKRKSAVITESLEPESPIRCERGSLAKDESGENYL